MWECIVAMAVSTIVAEAAAAAEAGAAEAGRYSRYRPQEFCAPCGAPLAEAKEGACSYCRTPVPRSIGPLFGHTVVRPEMVARVT